MKISLGLAALILLVLAGLMGYVRMAPDNAGLWHVALREQPGEAGLTAPSVDRVARGARGFVPSSAPESALARLAEIAAAAPRTRLLAGSLAEGRITWISRSKLWGFPDYITAEVAPQGLRLWSRQRYGVQDMGVNPQRLADWLSRL